MLGIVKFKEKVMPQAGELIKKPLAVVLLLILLLPLLAGCGGDDLRSIEARVTPGP